MRNRTMRRHRIRPSAAMPTLLTLLLWIAVAVPPSYAMFRDSGPLFKDSKHVQTLTDAAFGAMKNRTDEVWIIDFYAPWCPHCRDFAPEYEKIASFYASSAMVKVGVVDCTKSTRACYDEEVMAYPTVKLFHVPATATSGKKYQSFGRKTKDSVVKWVEDLLAEAHMKSGISADNVDQQIELIRNDRVRDELGLPDETSLKMKYARLQDAGSAAIFTLENALFMGVSVLEGERYHAALLWIESLGATFPLETNRAVFRDLAQAMRQRDSWDYTAWNSLLSKWKAIASASTFPKTLLIYNEETAWSHCNTYTCGLWTLFHSMSVGTGLSSCPLKPSHIASAIRFFVMHFFGCDECVKHFLAANPPAVIDAIAKEDTQGNSALILWLWRMHNTVNKVTKKPFWPSVKSCPMCFADNVHTPSLDPAALREDMIVTFVTSGYEHHEADIWSMNYQNNGVGAVLVDSLNGSSALVLAVVALALLLTAARRHHRLGAFAFDFLKREHAA